jgi:RecA/RadA recombinase
MADKITEISWGIDSLDNTIGKIKPEIITLVYGNTGSGKTTLSVYYPAARIFKTFLENDMLDDNHKIIIVDTEEGVDFQRFKQVLENNGLNADKILKEFVIYKYVDTFEDQHTYIVHRIKSLIDEKGVKPLMISVDSLTSIYRGIILRAHRKFRLVETADYTGKLDLQLLKLRNYATEFSCPVFVTTWPSTRVKSKEEENVEEIEDTGLPFVGGKALGFYPKIIIEIAKQSSYSSERIIRLFKARNIPPGLSCIVRLSDKGFDEVEIKKDVEEEE